MSADNWAPCFNCKSIQIIKLEHLKLDEKKEIADKYGKIPLQELLDIQSRYAKARDQVNKNLAEIAGEYDQGNGTFREEYEIYGAEDGEVVVSYSGHCDRCGHGLRFEHCVPITGAKQ